MSAVHPAGLRPETAAPKAQAKNKLLLAVAIAVWTVGYGCLVASAVINRAAPWPMVFGAWSLAWELDFTRRSLKAGKFTSAVGFASWASADMCLMTVLVLYGQGHARGTAVTDELLLMPLDTMQQRLTALVAYFGFFTAFLRSCTLLMGETFVKYQSFFGLHVLVAAQLRLPSFRAAIASASWHEFSLLVHGYGILTFISHVLWAHKFVQPNLSNTIKLYVLLLPTLNLVMAAAHQPILDASSHVAAIALSTTFFASFVPGVFETIV